MDRKGWVTFAIGVGHPPGMRINAAALMGITERMTDGIGGMHVRAGKVQDFRCHSVLTMAATFPGEAPPDDGFIIAEMHRINPTWTINGFDCWYIESKWKKQPQR